MSRNILLKNGIALIHDAKNHVVPTKTDVLVEDGRIAKIGQGLQASESVEVIDCNDKIISPGFVDTHHHGWQTQLKGRHANQLLFPYMIDGNFQSYQYTPKDVFYGQLSAMLEALAAGTTTVVDHAHITHSPDHAKLGIYATASSGIRGVFCYTPLVRVKHFNPFTLHANPLEDWVMKTFSDLADEGPWAEGRVTLGFAWDLFFLPPDVIKGVFAQVTEKGVKTITTHSSRFGNVVQGLKALGLLDERILISHQNGLSKDEAELLRAAGAHISSTPSTELQMAMGRPVCFDEAFLDGGVSGKNVGLQDNASLGIDCHSNNAGSIISEARVGLQDARNHFNEFYMKQGKTTRRLPESLSVEAAFNLATIKGAESAKLSKEIGRIQEGYRADLAIFDALSPGMIGAAQHDPVAAIILHSSPADIDMVIVDGAIRKKDGRLVAVDVHSNAKETVGREELEWNAIAREVLKSRQVIQAEIDKVDVEEGLQAVMKLFHVDESLFVD